LRTSSEARWREVLMSLLFMREDFFSWAGVELELRKEFL
jgi:hypothetical protein